MKEEKVLYVLKGEQGTGKSELAMTIVRDGNRIFEADKFPGIYTEAKLYVWEKQGESHRWNQEQVNNAMRDGVSPIAVANTSMELWNYEAYLNLASQYGYTSVILRCEGILYPDGSAPVNIHNVSQYIVDRTRCKYEPYVHQIENPYPHKRRRDFPPNCRMFRFFDRDKTLIYNPLGGAPKLKEMELIPGILGKISRWKKQGDIGVLVSNQGGLEPNPSGLIHKTEEELLLEAKLIYLWLPGIDLQIYCPKLDGSEAWVYDHESESFEKVQRKPFWQGFRKPQAGMLELAMERFDGQYDAMEFIGDSVEDYLAALAANVPYKHIHDTLYA